MFMSSSHKRIKVMRCKKQKNKKKKTISESVFFEYVDERIVYAQSYNFSNGKLIFIKIFGD